MALPDKRSAKVLITGCGRSGTRYVVALLRMHGLDVRHEQLGRDGTASWCMAVDSARTPWGPARRECEFRLIFHQVRSPLPAIQSMTALKEESWRYIGEWIPCDLRDPPLLRSAKYWYYWNSHAERIAGWRYRIEDFRDIYPEFCDRLGISPDPVFLDILPRDINTRSHGWLLHVYDELCLRVGRCPSNTIRTWLSRQQPQAALAQLTWDELTELDAELSRSISAKALEYGYSVETA